MQLCKGERTQIFKNNEKKMKSQKARASQTKNPGIEGSYIVRWVAKMKTNLDKRDWTKH